MKDVLFSTFHLKCSTTAEPLAESPLIFEKQIIYAGEFEGEFPFEITEKTLDHWQAEFEVLTKQHNFELIVPVEHVDMSEANTKATISQLIKKTDDQGRLGLFGRFVFESEKDAKLAASHDVSVYSPPVFETESGYRAVRPLTHVALTTDPLIPGLQNWAVLAASAKRPKKMLTDVASALGITIPEGADEAAILALVLKAIADLQKSPEAPPADPAAAPADAAVKASMTDLRRQNRGLLIDALVSSAKLTPAEATAWKKTYCGEGELVEGFDAAHTLACSRSPIVQPGQKSPPQVPGQVADNPLVAAAKAKAQAAKVAV